MASLSLRAVDAVLILGNESPFPRLLAKYYSAPHTQPSAGAGAAGSSRPEKTAAPESRTAGAGAASAGVAAAAAAAAALNGLPGQANHPYVTVKEQLAFEKGLVEKAEQQKGADLILYDGRLVVFKTVADVTVYVVGPGYENELLLLSVAVCLKDVLTSLFVTPTDQQTLDKQTILENYDVVTLAVDEIVDDGVVLDTDADAVLARVSRRPQPEITAITDLDLSEQGLISMWKFAKKALQEGGL